MTAPRLGDRALFPDLEARAYLAHAAVSPLPAPVQARMAEVARDFGRGGLLGVSAWLPMRDRLRAAAAALVGGRPVDIALTTNTSAGVVDVALCFPFAPGDRVVLFEGEFPANVTPWQRAAALFDLELVWVPLAPFARSLDEGLAVFEATLALGARLVAVSAVQFSTGLRMPLERMAALCRAHGAELFVDAIQACGIVPVDVGWGIDYLTSGGHKHLFGPEGTGFLYVAPERVGALRPHLAGWLSHERFLDFLTRGPGHLDYGRPIRARADLFEAGAANVVGLAGLEVGIDLVLGLGVPAIEAHLAGYLDPLEEGLRARGFRSLRHPDPRGRSGLLSVDPPPGADVLALHRGLVRQGFPCSLPDGHLRFAPGFESAVDEVPEVLAAVDALLA